MSNQEKLSLTVAGGSIEERVQLRNLVGNLLSDALGTLPKIGYFNIQGLFVKPTGILKHKSITLDMTQTKDEEYDRSQYKELCDGDYVVKITLFGETLYLGHDTLVNSFCTARKFDKLVEIANEHEDIIRLVNEYLFHSYSDLSKMPEDSPYVVEIWYRIGEFDASRQSSHVFQIQNSVPKSS